MFVGNFTNADGEICFEAVTDGLPHDYTLSCEANSLAYSLLQKLIAICNIYSSGGQGIAFDDCARFFTNTTNFGPGFFAGDRCSLTYHADIGSPDQCLVNVLNQNTPTGFGTSADYAIIIGIPVALLFTFCLCFLKCRTSPKNQPNERSGLLEGKREIHPPTGKPDTIKVTPQEEQELPSQEPPSYDELESMSQQQGLGNN